jgi:hypothetical protein
MAADETTSGGAEHAMACEMPGDPAHNRTLDAALGLNRGDTRDCGRA